MHLTNNFIVDRPVRGAYIRAVVCWRGTSIVLRELVKGTSGVHAQRKLTSYVQSSYYRRNNIVLLVWIVKHSHTEMMLHVKEIEGIILYILCAI